MSNDPNQTATLFPLERRRFLRGAGIACTVLGTLRALPAFATTSVAASATPRALQFVHTHTGEKLEAQYFDGGSYVDSSLHEINHLLRDFRTGDIFGMDPQLLDILYDLKVLANHDAPFEIISGYRSPATNAMLHRASSGVASQSQHMLGKAVDIRLTGYSTRQLGEFARSLARGGVGFYPDSDFVHVDTGRVRYW